MIVYCIWFLQAKNYKSKPKNPLDYFKTAQFHNRMFSHLCAELEICCQTNRKNKTRISIQQFKGGCRFTWSQCFWWQHPHESPWQSISLHPCDWGNRTLSHLIKSPQTLSKWTEWRSKKAFWVRETERQRMWTL